MSELNIYSHTNIPGLLTISLTKLKDTAIQVAVLDLKIVSFLIYFFFSIGDRKSQWIKSVCNSRYLIKILFRWLRKSQEKHKILALKDLRWYLLELSGHIRRNANTVYLTSSNTWDEQKKCSQETLRSNAWEVQETTRLCCRY